MPEHKGDEVKVLAVEYMLAHHELTQEEICDIFQCSRRSLMRWVEKYNENGDISRRNREAISYKVKEEHVKFITKTIKENKFMTLEDMLSLLKVNFTDLDITIVTLFRVIFRS